MFLTEDEALGKWCPFGRQPFTCSNSGSIAAAAINRQPRGEVPSCLGAVCMAWRWEKPKPPIREIDLVTSDIVDAPPRRGYCGAFGRPDNGD